MVLHHVCREFTVGEACVACIEATCVSFCLCGGVFDGRDDWIRTSDLTHPKGALYQAEPRPDYYFRQPGRAAEGYATALSVHESAPVAPYFGATYSFGSCPPSPKKNSVICSTRNSCASRVHGCRRYSFNSIFCRSTHSPQLFFETFLNIFWPKSESNGGSSSPSISALNLVSKTICAIRISSFGTSILRCFLKSRASNLYDNCLRHCNRSRCGHHGRQRIRSRSLR